MEKTNIETTEGFVGFLNREEKKLEFYQIVNDRLGMKGSEKNFPNSLDDELIDDIEFWLSECRDVDLIKTPLEINTLSGSEWIII